MAKPQKYTDEQIIEVTSRHTTMRQAAEELGMQLSNLALRAKKLGVYKANQGGRGIARDSRPDLRIPTHEILEGKHPHYQTNLLKKRLFKEGIKEQKCEQCGCEDALTLDHIDGVNNNHVLSNLCILCHNCHSKTVTFAGKNKTNKSSLIGDEEMIRMIIGGDDNRTILSKLDMVGNGANYKRVDRLRGIIDVVKSLI